MHIGYAEKIKPFEAWRLSELQPKIYLITSNKVTHYWLFYAKCMCLWTLQLFNFNFFDQSVQLIQNGHSLLDSRIREWRRRAKKCTVEACTKQNIHIHWVTGCNNLVAYFFVVFVISHWNWFIHLVIPSVWENIIVCLRSKDKFLL